MSCNNEPTLFTLQSDTGITFSNDLIYNDTLNPYTYRNFYNGGGVAIGDINNDGLEDIYFTGNQVDNALYLNQGDLQFTNITDDAAVSCSDIWSSGVTMVDINADGYLDIYVCKAGPPGGVNRHNELFINNGDLTFTESSASYGLDIVGLSVQSAFFDYDRDGDLDCYLLNNSIRAIGGFDLIQDKRLEHSELGNKLLRNDNGLFVDVTQSAGIYSSEIGFGLGITLADYNMDSWPDMYISNDFFEKDYMYINQQDGTFLESGEAYFECFSLGSMGADAADMDNDLYPEIMVTEMFPSTTERKKTKAVYDNWKKYQQTVAKGYYHQVPRNTLQHNIQGQGFLEIGRQAHVADTDWSWSCLMQDYDNDGYKDIFISNGIYKDLLDRDYLDFAADNASRQIIQKYKEKGVRQLIDSMTSEAIPNCMFTHKGDMSFTNVTSEWGMGQPGFSNGAVYSDLDNDGDLDIVINNVNSPASIYENNSDVMLTHNYISFELVGKNKNTKAVGSKVITYACGNSYMNEFFPSKGFKSSGTHRLHFGIGECMTIDSIKVIWPDGKQTVHNNLVINQLHQIEQGNTNHPANYKGPQLENVLRLIASDTLDYNHSEYTFSQFNREPLLASMNKRYGPAIATADIDGDGDMDVFIGGAKNQKSVLLIHEKNGYKTVDNFLNDEKSEVTDAVFFDSDNDGDLDLYTAHGGTAYAPQAQDLHDVLYINDGSGQFSREVKIKYEKPIATSCIAISDIDNNGYNDIVIGSNNSNIPYGSPGSVYIYLNNGDNTYSESHVEIIKNIGIISDVETTDIDNDGRQDLIIAGEWMSVKVMLNEESGWEESNGVYPFTNKKGIWNKILLSDLNQDGKEDIFLGNIGNNTTITDQHRLYIGDYDNNGKKESILCEMIDEKAYPIVDFDILRSQFPAIKKKVLYHKQYAQSTMTNLFGKDKMEDVYYLSIDDTETCLYISDGDNYKRADLPQKLQYSSIHSAYQHTFTDDETSDLLVGGNHYQVLPLYGREDASTGWILVGELKDGNYKIKEIKSAGIRGEMRDIEKTSDDSYIIGINDQPLIKYKWK